MEIFQYKMKDEIITMDVGASSFFEFDLLTNKVLALSGSGEPLLNFELIKKISVYLKELEKKIEKKILITLITNGTI